MNQPIRIPETMNAVGIEGGKGPAEALKLVTLPTAKPGAGQILVRVAAAGVNQPDLLQREGRYPLPPGTPETMGLEIAGEVVALGEGVSRWKVGDSVCALLLGGGYAEYAAVDARHVLPVPEGLTIEQAAGLPETVFTVFGNVFERGNLKAGETLLIHGGTSGIGVTTIAMAKALGARVITTGRGADKARHAQKLGADLAIDTTSQDFVDVVKGDGGADVADLAIDTTSQDFVDVVKGDGGADVVLDMVGGDYVQKNLDVLKPDGRDQELARAVKEIGRNVTDVQGDVANLGDLDRLFAQIKREKGKLDVVFANAGGAKFAPLGNITEEHYDSIYDINVKGLLFTAT